MARKNQEHFGGGNNNVGGDILSMAGLSKGWFIFGFIGSILWWYIHTVIEFILYRVLFYQLTLRDGEEEFRWFNAWFSFHPYTLHGSKRVKPQKVTRFYGGVGTRREYESGISEEGDSKKSRVKFVPGLGLHFFYVKSKLCIVRLSQSSASSLLGSVVAAPNELESETITIYVPCYDWMNKLTQYIYPCVDNYNNAPSVSYMLEMGGFPSSLIPPDADSSFSSTLTTNNTFNSTLNNSYNYNNTTTTNTTTTTTNNNNNNNNRISKSSCLVKQRYDCTPTPTIIPTTTTTNTSPTSANNNNEKVNDEMDINIHDRRDDEIGSLPSSRNRTTTTTTTTIYRRK